MYGRVARWWFLICLVEAALRPATICDLGGCTCYQGKVRCDCSRSTIKEIILETGLLQDYFISSISVANCARVHVASRAVSGLPALQQVTVTNIASLTMEEQAFSWTTDDSRHSGLGINISQCAIPEVPSYSFRGSLRDVLLTEVNISRTRAYSFSAIDHADKLQFSRVSFDEVDRQAFKKFGVNFLLFIDTFISKFAPRTLINVDVYQEARFQNIKIGRIESNAIQMHSVRQFKIIKSILDYIERGAFHIHTKGDVSIHDNTIGYLGRGAFIGVTVDSRYLRDAGKQDLVFENNTFADVEGAALAFNTSAFDLRLEWIRLNRPCTCASVESWTNNLVNISPDLTVNTAMASKMYCLKPKPTNIKDFHMHNCEISTISLVIEIVLIVGAVAALVAVGSTLCYMVRKKGKRYINVPKSPASIKPADYSKPHMLVVPDGKTYRETELHVIVEHVEPIVPTEYVKGAD